MPILNMENNTHPQTCIKYNAEIHLAYKAVVLNQKPTEIQHNNEPGQDLDPEV